MRKKKGGEGARKGEEKGKKEKEKEKEGTKKERRKQDQKNGKGRVGRETSKIDNLFFFVVLPLFLPCIYQCSMLLLFYHYSESVANPFAKSLEAQMSFSSALVIVNNKSIHISD